MKYRPSLRTFPYPGVSLIIRATSHKYLFLIFLVIQLTTAVAEGTKQLEPAGANPTLELSFYNAGWTSNGYRVNFALPGCDTNHRLNVHIQNFATEKICFGFNTLNQPLFFQLRDPNGFPVYSNYQPLPASGSGYISNWTQAVNGPIAAGGYTPLTYVPTKNGDYYFEFATDANGNTSGIDGKLLKYFDISVVQNSSTVIEGRVWSRAWQFNGQTYGPNSSFYLYTDDGFVTKMNINGWSAGVWELFANQYGCLNTGNWIADRKSIHYVSSSNWPGDFPQYKVFLNDPDVNTYPTGSYGGVCNLVASTDCSGTINFHLNVTKSGMVQVRLDLPPAGTNSGEDVTLVSPVTGSFACNTPNLVTWNGLNGFGIPVPDGSQAMVTVDFLNGLTNLPMYDVETNPNGICVQRVRPIPGSGQTEVPLMWDDTDCTGGYLNILTGCVCSGTPYGCHYWQGNEAMMNTWWFDATTTTLAQSLTIHRTPGTPVFLNPGYICSDVPVTIPVSVPSAEQYHWTLPDGSTIVTSVPEVTYTFPAAPSVAIISVYGSNTNCGNGPAHSENFSVVPTVNTVLSGADAVCSGNTFTYKTTFWPSGYYWYVSSGGTIVSGGTPADSTVSIHWQTPGTQKVKVYYQNSSDCVGPDSLMVVVSPCKNVSLKVFLEGLYAGSQLMYPVSEGSNPRFGPGIADQIIIELHNPALYSDIVYTLPAVNLSTSGTAIAEIPSVYNGSYYLTVRHRNHIETTSAMPVSFAGDAISYDFTTAASQAFGNNQRNMGGTFVLYGGDVTLDGLVDASDMIAVDNDNSMFLTGYRPSDLDGSGLTDATDLIIVDNNSSLFVAKVVPVD